MLAAAEAATSPDTFKRGDALAGGRYLLQYKLGSGPMGLAEGLGEGRFTTLWVSKDLESGQKVVLKLMEPGDAVSYTAGTREAALHAMAGRHPNIVPLLDAFEHRSAAGRHACMVLQREGSALDYAFMVLQMLQARDKQLAEQQQQQEQQQEQQQQQQQRTYPGGCLAGNPEGMTALRSTARQLLQALDHLHSRGLAHLNLSADNVLLDKPFLTEVEAVAAAGPANLLQSTWHAVLEKLGHKSSQQVLQQQLSEASADPRSYYTRATLHQATLKLTDFGRAVPFRQLAAAAGGFDVQQPENEPPWGQPLAVGANAQGEALHRATAAYNADGMVVMADPCLRPPEEILGLPYAAPAYDIWRLGCLLAELSTGFAICDTQTWGVIRQLKSGLPGHSDDALHLVQLQQQLGAPPRELIRKSPMFAELYTPGDILRITRVYNPVAAPLDRQISDAVHAGASKAEVNELQNFVTAMLAYDPAKRPSAGELLQHAFLQHGAEQEKEQQQQQQQQQRKR